MLILQIILTIIAWRNGWKWKSLLPVGVILLIAFFIGLGAGMSGGSIEPIYGLHILDAISIIILIIMCFVKPKSVTENKEDKTTKLD